MLALALALSQQPDISPVYRCAFEERSRMVLIKMSPTRWMAFNPKTCAIQKIWEGDVEWRGKVYDFSQNTSRARGKTLFELPSVLQDLKAVQNNPPLGRTGFWTYWDAVDAKLDNGVVTFSTDNGCITSPTIISRGYRNIYIAFDETSQAAPFRVDVMRGSEVTEWFDSTTHGSSDTDFQWNFKQIAVDRAAEIRFSSTKASAKKLRNVRIFADYEMFRSETQVETLWKGYQVTNGRAILEFNLIRPGSRVVVCQLVVGSDEMVLTASGVRTGITFHLPRTSGLSVEGRETAESMALTEQFRIKIKGGRQ